MPSLTLPAHAKVNLCLSVGPPNPPGTTLAGRDVSGYHAIASWMAPLDLRDEVEVSTTTGSSACRLAWAPDALRQTPLSWDPGQDLTMRALRALEGHVGRELPTRISVRKRIPVGGGLGGGSSDAACVLMGVNEIYQLGLRPETLAHLGSTLGADVAFFVDGACPTGPVPVPPGHAIVSSLGEVVERVEACEGELVLVVPPFGCETRAVYRAFDGWLDERVAQKRAEIGPGYRPPGARLETVRKRHAKGSQKGLRDGLLFNDLTIPAMRVEPRLGALVTGLSNAARGQAHVTGSGSTLFLLAEPGRADRLLERVRAALPAGEEPCVALPARLV